MTAVKHYPAETHRHPVRRFLVTGLIALLPLLVTVFILAKGFQFIHATLGKAILLKIEDITGIVAGASWHTLILVGCDIVALAIVLTFLLALGFTLGTFIGRRIFEWIERRIAKIPIVSIIYPLVRQVTDMFTNGRQRQFGQVVAVEYPRKGIYSIGFVTGHGLEGIRTPEGKQMLRIFLPNSPSPVTGWLLFFPEEEVIPLNITKDEAFKLVLSGGVVAPEDKTQQVDISRTAQLPKGDRTDPNQPIQ